MDINLQALILGVVQGLTEYLPVSSSGHLVLVPYIFNWNSKLINSMEFGVAVHFGTFVGVFFFFIKEWLSMAKTFFTGIGSAERRKQPEWKLLWSIILGTVPGAVLGVLFEGVIEEKLRSPLQVAVLLVVMGVFMFVADRVSKKDKTISDLTYLKAFVIGLFQSVALMPGVSRSGITISIAMLLGFRRDDSAKFSFLLSTPIIAGACLFEGKDIIGSFGRDGISVFLIGVVSSAIVGYLAVKYLIKFLQKNTLDVFVYYRLILGLLVLGLMLFR